MTAIVSRSFTVSDSRENVPTNVFYWDAGKLVNVEYDKLVDSKVLKYGGKDYFFRSAGVVFDYTSKTQ